MWRVMVGWDMPRSSCSCDRVMPGTVRTWCRHWAGPVAGAVKCAVAGFTDGLPPCAVVIVGVVMSPTLIHPNRKIQTDLSIYSL